MSSKGQREIHQKIQKEAQQCRNEATATREKQKQKTQELKASPSYKMSSKINEKLKKRRKVAERIGWKERGNDVQLLKLLEISS